MPNYSTPAQAPQQSSHLENLLTKFIQIQEQTNQAQNRSIAKLEAQFDQLTLQLSERENGQFLSQTIPNPKGHPNQRRGQCSVESNEHVHAIHTLRSEKTIDNRVEMTEEPQREGIFLGKSESSRKVVKPEKEDLKKNLKENAEREK
ncbi:hypothetical protein MRB53_026108 [Persea americana]|uniref:Uncharacterized protein n=1 Tax=Persea americana TaxID=3435 RepID=A0ACC2LGZ8_PERAE|nr:hypothetical protein MRB53_026108 [Persea americana]